MKNFTLITGATGGLGRAFVSDCAERKLNLILTGTNNEKLKKLSKEIGDKYKDIVILYKECNLADEKSINELINYIKEKKVNVNMLINNAGYIFETSFLSCSDDEVLTAIRVNVEGTVNLTQKILKSRVESEKFYLLTVSSLSCYSPMPQMAIYASSKVFLTNWSVALREELKNKNIFVSCVCPGGMATNEAMKRSIKSQGFFGRLSCLKVEKVAKISLNGLYKNKAIIIPGWFNKFMHVSSVLSSKKFQAKVLGKRWYRCEKKRGEAK